MNNIGNGHFRKDDNKLFFLQCQALVLDFPRGCQRIHAGSFISPGDGGGGGLHYKRCHRLRIQLIKYSGMASMGKQCDSF